MVSFRAVGENKPHFCPCGMVVGFLRKGKCYRAPCRWYPGGPIGTIEYYVAKPGAQYYLGDHIYFPLGFFGEDGVNDGDVGELTGEGFSREYYNGVFADAEPGVQVLGSNRDFRGETPYPGPFEGECDCVPAPVNNPLDMWMEVAEEEFEIVPAEPDPTFDCFYFPGGVRSIWRVTFSGMISGASMNTSDLNGTWDLPYVGSCTWRLFIPGSDMRIQIGYDGNWTLAVGNEFDTGAIWRNFVDDTAASPKVLNLEAFPVWTFSYFHNDPVPTVTIT